MQNVLTELSCVGVCGASGSGSKGSKAGSSRLLSHCVSHRVPFEGELHVVAFPWRDSSDASKEVASSSGGETRDGMVATVVQFSLSIG